MNIPSNIIHYADSYMHSFQDINNDQNFLLKELEEWAKCETPEENRQEAKKRILDAYASNSSSLDLNGLELKSLPENIGNLTALQELDLSGNQLTQLPDSIGNLTALETLFFFENQLTQLPDSIQLIASLFFPLIWDTFITSSPTDFQRDTYP